MEKNSGFVRHGIFKRIMSLMLVFAMLVTMGTFSPMGATVVKAEEGHPSPVIVKNSDGTYNVTFWVNNSTAEKMYVAGNMTSPEWGDGKAEMTKETESTWWSATVSNIAGKAEAYEYKFIEIKGGTNDHWYADPQNLAEPGNYEKNSQFYLSEAPRFVDKGEGRFDLTLSYAGTDTTKSVEVMGTDLGGSWDIGSGRSMSKVDGSNIWTKTFTDLPAGKYQYKYVINASDDGWKLDPANEQQESGNSAITLGSVSYDFVSPEINGKEVTFRYKDASASKIRVAGNMNGWGDSTDELVKGEDDVWSKKLTLSAGEYQYKFILGDNNWKTDQVNTKKKGDDCVFVVPGLADGTLSVVKDEAKELPTLKLYAADGASEDKTPVYTVKTEAVKNYVTIADGKITVSKDCTASEFELKATVGEETATVKVDVKDVMYTYTIYYYDDNEAHMTTDAADLWLWEKDGAGLDKGTDFTLTEVISTEVDGKNKDLTWLKAEVELPYQNLGIIARSKGEWSWQTGDCYFNNKDKKEQVTLYVVNGKKNVYTSVPKLNSRRERHVILEYDRPANDYEGWNVYSWNTGLAGDTELYSEEINGKHYIVIPVADYDVDLKLAFCMRRTTSDNAWAEKDGGDHYVDVPADQTVVKAKFVQDKGIVEVLPYNTGYKMAGAENKISFYYRDDSLMVSGKEDSLSDVKVVINGNEHEMKYDSKTERYVYDLEGITSGEYAYYYKVGSDIKLDSYNPDKKVFNNEECSVVTYKSFEDLKIKAAVLNENMDYNDNNVVSITFDGKDAQSITRAEIAEIIVDQSELGLAKFAVSPELMKGTISCLHSTSLGKKQIPVTLTDIYGNIYSATAEVNVVERKKTDGDFDWDEAIIYFAVTDRFFDGDETNNRGVDKEGSLSYHGGDFAGLTQKLDELKELGVNTVWITPIVENSDTTTDKDGQKIESTGYHGYWASDFTKLNPHLGTEEQFKTLIEQLHKRDMKIMVDVVVNHAGYGTEEYFNTFIKDAQGNYVEMLRNADNTIDGSDVYAPLAGLPDFVTENEVVRDQVIQWQTDWVKNYGIDYYRVDTVKHVDATSWQAFKNSLTAADPKFKMIGEYSGAGYASDSGVMNNGAMDSLLDFDFNNFSEDYLTGDIASVEASLLARNAVLNNTSTLGSFINSHDEDGLQDKLQTDKKLTEEEAHDLMKVAATLTTTAKGQTVIYYGEELGFYGKDNYPYQTNRYDYDFAELEKQKADADSIYNHYKKMLSIRNQYTDVFARGSRDVIDANNEKGYDVFTRSYKGQTLYVGINIKQEAQTVSIPVAANGVYKDLYSGKEYTSSESKITVELAAAKMGGTVVLVAAGTTTGNNGSSSGTTGGSSLGSISGPTVTPEQTKPESSQVETTTETRPDGSKIETTTETKPDGSKVETVKEATANSAGNEVVKETVTKTDAEGNVSSIVETSKIAVAENTVATVVIGKDANGDVVEAKATVSEKVSDSKATFTADIVAQIKEAAGQDSIMITVEVKNNKGKDLFTVTADAKNLTAGNKLFAVMRKANGKTMSAYALATKATGYVLVNSKTYKVGKDGSIALSMKKQGDYELITAKDLKAINKAVVSTVKLKKASATLKAGKKTQIAFSDKLNMDNVKTVKYTSNKKKVATVNKNGKITAKKKGNAKITADVTLKNGTKKTVAMNVKVK